MSEVCGVHHNAFFPKIHVSTSFALCEKILICIVVVVFVVAVIVVTYLHK